MHCVTTMKFSALVNGVLTMPFSPCSRLKQRDPLSPYLFLYVSQALSYLITSAKEYGRL